MGSLQTGKREMSSLFYFALWFLRSQGSNRQGQYTTYWVTSMALVLTWSHFSLCISWVKPGSAGTGGLFLTLCLGFIPRSTQCTIWTAKNGTWVGCRPGKHLTCCSFFLAFNLMSLPSCSKLCLGLRCAFLLVFKVLPFCHPSTIEGCVQINQQVLKSEQALGIAWKPFHGVMQSLLIICAKCTPWNPSLKYPEINFQ